MLWPESWVRYPTVFKGSHCLFLFQSHRASRTKAARLPPILKQITSILATINTVESREWAGKIKHHRDPKGHRLKKPIPMSSNYVFMKAADTEPTRKSSETPELDRLCEGERQNNYWGRSIWQWACSIISYTAWVLGIALSARYGCSDCKRFLPWPWVWKGKERCPWAVGEHE